MTGPPTRSVRAYLGLGANLGDAPDTLAWAIGQLAATRGLRVRQVSPLYRTAPWGVTDQPDFHNAVVAIEMRSSREMTSEAAALELLALLKGIEREAGRRPGRRWGPRELDLDLLLFGRARISVERSPSARSIEAEADRVKATRLLVVPHRDLGERLFVLEPLAAIAPLLVPPGWDQTVETRRRQVAAGEPAGAVRLVGTWDPAAGRWR